MPVYDHRRARLLRSFGLVVFSATTAFILYRPRLPSTERSAELLCILMLLAAARAPLLCGAGMAASLLWAHSWAFDVFRSFVGMSLPSALLLFTLSTALITLSHIGLFYVAVGPLKSVPLVGAAFISVGECAVAYVVPWYEAHTLGYALADASFWPPVFLKHGGPAALTFSVTAAALYLLKHQPWRAAGLATSLAALAALQARLDPAVPVTEYVSLQGLQLAPPASGFDWPTEQVAAYRAAEGSEHASLSIWPERAYPFRERLLENPSLKRLPPPENFSRILGMHVAIGLFRTANAVILQSPASSYSTVGFRFKQRLAPLYETAWLEAPENSKNLLQFNKRPLLLPICYEILDRRYFTSATAALGVSVSADSFDPSGEASKLLTRAAALRAKECGCSFVRVSNGSFSGAFGPDGKPITMLGRGPGVLRASVPLVAVNHRCGAGHMRILVALSLFLIGAALVRWAGAYVRQTWLRLTDRSIDLLAQATVQDFTKNPS